MYRILCFILLFLLATTSLSYAHPPSDIILEYDFETGLCSVVIMHNVENPQAHFIKKVSIALNGQEIISHSISLQDEFDMQVLGYIVPDVRKGDTLSIEAYCSISGKMKKELKAE
ncbi:MAG: hypothetical protein KJ952_02040 [Candidatus Omnitrophica bacterium]|nr:hypothetical protein [Candidatus Omnitrophota bacterium]